MNVYGNTHIYADSDYAAAQEDHTGHTSRYFCSAPPLRAFAGRPVGNGSGGPVLLTLVILVGFKLFGYPLMTPVVIASTQAWMHKP